MREFDPEHNIKLRIHNWLMNEDPHIYGDYNGNVNSDDLEELLLKFHRQLAVWEAERQSA